MQKLFAPTIRCLRVWAIVALVLRALMSAIPVGAGDTYELSGQAHTLTWPKGDWNGTHVFPGGYCLQFPSPGTAQQLVHAFFNKGGIYLTTVDYPRWALAIMVAVSSIPARRTVEEEMGRIWANEQRNRQASSQMVDLTKFETAFGPTIGFVVQNAAMGSPPSKGPYPLIRLASAYPDGMLHSLAVHRLFVRGPGRFEVALFQMVNPPVRDSAIDERQSKLMAMADNVVRSLQTCTAKLPPRLAK